MNRTIRASIRATRQFALVAVILVGPAEGLSAQTRINWRPALEDSVLSDRWEMRREVVAVARVAVESLSVAGRQRFVDLLERELDGTIPVVAEPGCCDEESYGGYLADLIWIVERFNSPRATPLLARQGIAWSMGSRFQVARAGDVAVPMLLETWERTPTIRHGVIRTFGIMVGFADSTGAPLSSGSRATARRIIMAGFESAEPWQRRAASQAAEDAADASYLPVLRYLETTDSATLDGHRYVALGAASIAWRLADDSAGASFVRRAAKLRESLGSWCETAAGGPPGQCRSLHAKLDAAETAMARGAVNAARGVSTALVNQLEGMGADRVGSTWYALLRGQALDLIR